MGNQIKLNLGCGKHPVDGYINVDKYGEPDVRHDLETFPWPWEDSSVSMILLNHVLEHLGQETNIYLNIIKEIYRVCENRAVIHIVVPHPRHDDFINDPTHVRIVTPETIALFSKSNNRKWIEGGFASTPLGIYLDVDFEIQQAEQLLDTIWIDRINRNEVTMDQVSQYLRQYNNVIKEYRMVVNVIK